jgi:hypothetical protein
MFPGLNRLNRGSFYLSIMVPELLTGKKGTAQEPIDKHRNLGEICLRSADWVLWASAARFWIFGVSRLALETVEAVGFYTY